MQITKSKFGNLEGQEIDLYTLSNGNGMTVKITNYGATVTSIQVPVNGGLREVACGFDTLDGYFSKEYKANAPYFGGTVGRYCSQIKDARFSLNGKDYQLAEMVGKNNLHGGLKGFDKKIWSVSETANGLEFSLKSADLEEGFPGNVDAKVTFNLTDDNSIDINYEATTDQETPLSMTNHTYFNLSGFQENVEGFVAQVNTTKKQGMDDTGSGTGEIVDVSGQVDDMSTGKKIGDAHEGMGDGFENFYVFDNPDFALNHLATISSEEHGLSLEVHSTEPCMLLYTGKYTSDDLKRETGDQFGKYRGFCFETHRYQNGPNIPGSPATTTKPGETFKSQTIFSFK
ncbi:MAG: galactose mutarotase [Cyclobacteriaceae bacterium]